MTLTVIANLATAFVTLFTAFGLILLGVQLWLQRKDQKNQAIAHLFDEVVTPEFRQKLLFVYSREPETLTLSKLSQSEREIVEEVTARFDGLGFRVRTGLVPKQEAMELFWDLVVRCSQQLRPHILDQRERRGVLHKYKADFHWLACECKIYHLRRLSSPYTKKISLDELLRIEPLPIFKLEAATDKTYKQKEIAEKSKMSAE